MFLQRHDRSRPCKRGHGVRDHSPHAPTRCIDVRRATSRALCARARTPPTRDTMSASLDASNTPTQRMDAGRPTSCGAQPLLRSADTTYRRHASGAHIVSKHGETMPARLVHADAVNAASQALTRHIDAGRAASRGTLGESPSCASSRPTLSPHGETLSAWISNVADMFLRRHDRAMPGGQHREDAF